VSFLTAGLLEPGLFEDAIGGPLGHVPYGVRDGYPSRLDGVPVLVVIAGNFGQIPAIGLNDLDEFLTAKNLAHW
jgi:hypothetical protein